MSLDLVRAFEIQSTNPITHFIYIYIYISIPCLRTYNDDETKSHTDPDPDIGGGALLVRDHVVDAAGPHVLLR